MLLYGAGILLTFGCMKIYDIFWNPSSISVCFGSMNVGRYLSWFTMLAMVVCVYHMDQIIKEETEEEPFKTPLFLFAFPTSRLIGGVVMKNWKTIYYAGAGYLMGENGQYDDLNLKSAIRRGTMVVKWLSTRHEFSEKTITFRMNVEINGSGHYVVQIEVRNDKCFRASGWTVDMLGKWIDDKTTQREIFGS